MTWCNRNWKSSDSLTPPAETSSTRASPIVRQELVAAHATMVIQGFAAQCAVGVCCDAEGERRYLGIWSNQGAPSELRAAYAGFELVDQPQWDVAVAPPARLADPLDRCRQQLAEIAKLTLDQLEEPQTRLNRAFYEYYLCDFSTALDDLDFLVEKKAVSPWVLQYRALTLARLGRVDEARAELAKYLGQANDASNRAYVQVVLAAWLGKHDDAAEQLDSAATAAASGDSLYNVACAAAVASQACAASDAQRAASFLGRAIELVETAVAHGYQNAAQLRTDFDLAVLHGEQRFLALVDRMEPPARYAAVWRADMEFESHLVEPTSPESQLKQARELAAQGYRPVAIAAFDVAELARVRDVRATPEAGILANSATKEGPAVSTVWHRPLVPDAAKEELAQQQATAAVALLRMGATERVWPLLTHRPDPRLRSYLVDRLAPCGGGPAAVLAQLQTESEVSRRRALIVAVGQFARAKLLSAEQQSAAVGDLAGWYADDPDAGIHAAAEWSLRQLDAQAEIARVREAFATGNVVSERQWYLTKEGAQTLVIVRPEGDFLMGSPVAEAKRLGGPSGKEELRHRRRIGRAYAIGAHEVTVEQFERFRAEHEFDRTISREPDAPANQVNWYDAAAFCNWLSEREEIPRDQWCYDPDQPFAEGMRLYPNYLQRAGYRLPSEAEWEYACRAGATTARYFGETERLLGEYAWFTRNSQDRWMLPVGSLKPNDWGLFDAYGNALEWCRDARLLYSKDRMWLAAGTPRRRIRLLRSCRCRSRCRIGDVTHRANCVCFVSFDRLPSSLKKLRSWRISLEQGTWLQRHTRQMVGHCRKHAFAINGNRPGSLTASDHLEQHLSRALVEEPMAQLHGCGQYSVEHTMAANLAQVVRSRRWSNGRAAIYRDAERDPK
ncbi:MAG TPA: SUMF1/EgtB/PvdO family nonheme iron enzyme, partial [Pirellulales bacterium]|nr:SUMF1/EgtB/PvdO family nonheme iron enzyme [Pirellulales bacterium]